MSDVTPGLADQELTDERSEAVPEREVMSLLGGGTASALPGLEDAATTTGTVAPEGSPDAGGATGSATESATGAPQTADETAALTGTDAAASSSESEPVAVDEDRSETLSQSDTAVSET
jgi:hypothetical protein